MKVNVFLTVIALITGVLIFYGFYSMNPCLLFSLPGSIVCTGFLLPAMSFSIAGSPRSTVSFKTLATLVFVISLIVNLFFLYKELNEVAFIITNVLFAAAGSVGLYLIYKSKQ